MKRPEGIELAMAALQVLHPSLAPNGTHWTLNEASDRLNAEAWRRFTPADWREACAYLTLQLITAESRNGERERLALHQIRSVLRDLATAATEQAVGFLDGAGQVGLFEDSRA